MWTPASPNVSAMYKLVTTHFAYTRCTSEKITFCALDPSWGLIWASAACEMKLKKMQSATTIWKGSLWYHMKTDLRNICHRDNSGCCRWYSNAALHSKAALVNDKPTLAHKWAWTVKSTPLQISYHKPWSHQSRISALGVRNICSWDFRNAVPFVMSERAPFSRSSLVSCPSSCACFNKRFLDSDIMKLAVLAIPGLVCIKYHQWQAWKITHQLT